MIPQGEMEAGVWELVFHAGDYLDAAGVAGEAPRFLDVIPIRFGIARRGGALPRAAAARALQLLDVSGELTRGPRADPGELGFCARVDKGSCR